MSEKKYVVGVRNRIIGDSLSVMTKSEIRGFNLVALRLSNAVDADGNPHTSGMWTVSADMGEIKRLEDEERADYSSLAE